ncbi:MAG: hypothetical protein QXS91_00105 [Candidatus Anstonellales archaeon]
MARNEIIKNEMAQFINNIREKNFYTYKKAGCTFIASKELMQHQALQKGICIINKSYMPTPAFLPVFRQYKEINNIKTLDISRDALLLLCENKAMDLRKMNLYGIKNGFYIIRYNGIAYFLCEIKDSNLFIIN